ncbi:hypothetical protein P691DRAFT_659188 [Macrolepiota fuliginosa MF-IS2]|uniref:Uncharacterized protein n=1 Tax=Macrolepiota fuliginosa MF-IS2 TaxID=1400762 RepID=A0A9P6C643_9AGAR|nr:hypothetical protein P691DRAFT_659188 [Macrolepiota fuliginosa MF-IS2]
MNIWSRELDILAEPSANYSPRFPPQSPRLQKTWSPRVTPKDALAQARVLAIFRSGRFPNKINNPSVVLDDLEPDALNELGSAYSYDGVESKYGDNNLAIQPDFDDEELFNAEESFSSSGSSSSRSTPVQDRSPHWYLRFQAVLSSRSQAECANACRILVLSNEWGFEELGELAYQLISAVLAGVPPVAVTACAVNIERTLLEAFKHEAASYFISCISESAFVAWHHYWNPGMDFSIYPGRHFLVTQQHLDAGYTFCRLLGSLFRANLVSRVSIMEVIDLTLQNVTLLEHVDAIGNLLSYATSELWEDASGEEKDQFLIDLYDVLDGLCEYHFLRPELVEEYEKKVEEICTIVVQQSS